MERVRGGSIGCVSESGSLEVRLHVIKRRGQMSEPIALQRAYWTEWNAANRERGLSEISRDQREMTIAWLSRLDRTNLDVIEVGCGAGWLCPALKAFGRVTATDLSEDVLARAALRVPDVNFVAGDFMALDFPDTSYDVVVTLEMLAHVADQAALVAKLSRLLRPRGMLVLATQNRPVLEKFNNVAPTEPGQLRKWLDRDELAALLAPHFEVNELKCMTPIAGKGVLRLVAGRKVRRTVRRFAGRLYDRALAGLGLGWTLMALAQKRGN
jgi:2-polyprenyl-3-methyl-5-hydroxy-6-metoxy-1,4-benzoquinol methylase